MALSFNSSPNTWIWSQGNCETCFIMDSDTMFVSDGSPYSAQLAFAGAVVSYPADSMTLNGTIFTFVVTTPVTITEILIDADNFVFASNILAALQTVFPTYSWSDSNTTISAAIIDVTAPSSGSSLDLTITMDFPSGGGFLISETLGLDPEVDVNCRMEYEVFLNGTSRFSGVTTPQFVYSEVSGAFERRLSIDPDHLISNFRDLYTAYTMDAVSGGSLGAPYVQRQSHALASMQLRARECCSGTPGSWVYSGVFNIMHGSCACDGATQAFNYRPQTSPSATLFMNFLPSQIEVCAGLDYLVGMMLSPDTYKIVLVEDEGTTDISDFEVTSIGLHIFNVTKIIENWATTLRNKETFTLHIEATTQPGPLGEALEISYRTDCGCCDEGQLQYVNCFGSYQTMFIGCAIESGIQVNALEYFSAEVCGSRPSRRQYASRYGYTTRTFNTLPLHPTTENLRLLEDFLLSSQHLLGGADSAVAYDIEPDEFILQDSQGKISIPITLRKSNAAFGLRNREPNQSI